MNNLGNKKAEGENIDVTNIGKQLITIEGTANRKTTNEVISTQLQLNEISKDDMQSVKPGKKVSIETGGSGVQAPKTTGGINAHERQILGESGRW